MMQQLQGACVRPMQVIEYQHQESVGCGALDQVDDCFEKQEPLRVTVAVILVDLCGRAGSLCRDPTGEGRAVLGDMVHEDLVGKEVDHRVAEVVTVFLGGLPDADTESDLQRLVGAAVVGVESPLHLDRAHQCAARRVELDHQSVVEVFDLFASVVVVRTA